MGDARYSAVPGGALHLPDRFEVPPFKTVRLTPAVAKRLVFMGRLLWLDDEPFAVFHDPTTPRSSDRWFAQYVPDEDWPE